MRRWRSKRDGEHTIAAVGENFYPLFDAAVNIITEDEERTEVFKAFFAPAFNSQAS